jgi:HSP20 family protein
MVSRFDPFRELDRLASVFEGSSNVAIPMDVVRSSNEVRVYLDVPGIEPGDIDLTVERNRLTVKVTRRWQTGENERLVVRERPSGDFVRTLALSEGLDATKVSAAYEHGVLVVTIPVAELAQPRRISIDGGSRPVEVTEASGSPAAHADNGSPVHAN